MRHRYVIANWKMNLPPEGIEPWADAINGADLATAALVVAPPFPYLERVRARLRDDIATAGQNCADQEKGAYTGEVSAAMLWETGARFVIVGHSERRSIYGEGDGIVARKLALAISTGLTPVLCIGESLRARDSGKVATVLADQLRACAQPALESAGEVILAYEPVWAIGTGRNATGSMVAETVGRIREALARFWPERFTTGAPILYGGSVTPDNVSDLVAHGTIDGFLVGGASLDSAKFAGIHAGMR
ncbi:MAG TPA: triose-phosphate isomerase [Thermoanaerobaculia bacterium]|nr:triose-phosphate isomerase [Thermoanaerobaculia bacterium]